MRHFRPIRLAVLALALLATDPFAARSRGDDRSFELVAKAVKTKDLADSKLAGADRGKAYREVPAKGWILVGLEVGVGPALGKDAIITVRPIFQTLGGDHILGTLVGDPPDLGGPLVQRPVRVTALYSAKARPGYAVSAVSTRGALWVDCLRVTFARIEGDHLDLKDTYSTDWMGTKGPWGEATASTGGRLPVGITGKAEPTMMMNVGLVHLTRPADLPVAGKDKPGRKNDPSPTGPKPDAPVARQPRTVSPAPPAPSSPDPPTGVTQAPAGSRPAPAPGRAFTPPETPARTTTTGGRPGTPAPQGTAPELNPVDVSANPDQGLAPAPQPTPAAPAETPRVPDAPAPETAPEEDSGGSLMPLLFGGAVTVMLIGAGALGFRVLKPLDPAALTRRKPDREEKAEAEPAEAKPADPPAGWASPLGLARPGLLLLLISLGIYLGSIGLHALLLCAAWVGVAIPNGLVVLTGLLGLANWLAGLVGLGLCVAGPARGRGLAIAATAVAAVHLILALVVANDGRSAAFTSHSIQMLSAQARMERLAQDQKRLAAEFAKNPAGAKDLFKEMAAASQGFQQEFAALLTDAARPGTRWGDLATQLPVLDKLGVVLGYQSGAFGGYILGLLAGLGELARLVLLLLVVGTLTGAGVGRWVTYGIAGAGAATVVAVLASLLAMSVVDGKLKDQLKPETVVSAPALPNLRGVRSVDEFRRRQGEWEQKARADAEAREEKQKSAQRTMKNWGAGAELFVYALHAGMLVFPTVIVARAYLASPRSTA